jgi:selenide,water dikinase
VLRPIAETFKDEKYPDLLVGLNSPDDAAIWNLGDGRGLVVTTDFFTPVVDDPFDYGSIAAANALSDVYAMGGKPFLALNIAAMPPDLPAEITEEIVRGGAEKAREAGVVIAGGHTVQDKEPKYGLAVIGFVDPKHILTKQGAKPGDKLILTKPLGFGVTTTALKRQLAAEEDVKEVVGWMTRLNGTASQIALASGVMCATDVTGFSLLGHGLEIAKASGVKLSLVFDQIPFVSCAHKYADLWTFPGGAADNRNYYREHVHFKNSIDETMQMLLFDPQTSGGLLMAVPEKNIEQFKNLARKENQPYWIIGEVKKGKGIEVN